MTEEERDAFERRILYDPELQKAVTKRLDERRIKGKSKTQTSLLCLVGAIASAVIAVTGYRAFFESDEIAELRQLETQMLALGQTRGSGPGAGLRLKPETDIVILELDLGLAMDPEYDVELVNDGDVVWSGRGTPMGDRLVLSICACDLSPGITRARVSAAGTSIATYAFEVLRQ